MSELSQKRLLVIALDGATWELLEDWIADDRLPHLGRLVAEGVSAPLESTVPPITPVAWLTFATGRNPAQHGVFDFFRPIRTRYTDLIPCTADLNSQPTLWGILSQRGRQVGLVNVPMTFPPQQVSGFIIPGVPAPARADPAYPPGLLQELQQLGGWDLTRNAAVTQGSFEETFSYLRDLVRVRVEATCYLLRNKPWDFFMVHFLETDQVQHSFWRFMDKMDHPLQNAILRLFQDVDQGIGQILSAAGDPRVILMSDHGMGPTQYHVNLNNWLIQEGFMHWQRRPATALRRLGYAIGLSPATIYRLLPPEVVRRLTLGHLRTGMARIPTEHVGGQLSLAQRIARRVSRTVFIDFNDIDWSRTLAYSTGTTQTGLIHFNVRGREPNGIVSTGKEYEQARKRISERLAGFTDPQTRRPLVERIYQREELYSGPHLDDAPDLIVTYRHKEYDQKKGTVFLSTHPVESVRDANASHRQQGIFVLRAPSIAHAGRRLEPVRIEDIASTALYLMEEAVPRELEGQVLEAALTVAYLTTHPVAISEEPLQASEVHDELRPDELEAVLRRLHDLGYVA